MLKNKAYLQNIIVPLINGFNNKEECTIKDCKLTSKILKFKRFYKDDIEELQEQGNALNEKYITPKFFEMESNGTFKSGDSKKYEEFLKENKELLLEEVKEYENKFNLEDFEDSEIAHWIINMLDDAELLGE